ncbi:hypothetical protein [Peribacillus frigoritolerans]|uniref:hypothetical protein n=1 Tax=Peribacillus frigoritolerans TaxID=450367 RepID=UPI0032E46801
MNFAFTRDLGSLLVNLGSLLVSFAGLLVSLGNLLVNFAFNSKFCCFTREFGVYS